MVVNRGVSDICLRVQSYYFGNWGPYAKSYKPRATPSGGEGKFTQKYIIVGCWRGSEICVRVQSYYFGIKKHEQFPHPKTTPSGGEVEFTLQIYHSGGKGFINLFMGAISFFW